MTALSVLDLSPLIGGMTAAEVIRETVAMVQIAEELGFDRFWVAEHHSIQAFGGSAPEILIREVIDAFAARYEITQEIIETATENVEFKVPRVLREPA